MTMWEEYVEDALKELKRDAADMKRRYADQLKVNGGLQKQIDKLAGRPSAEERRENGFNWRGNYVPRRKR